MDVRKELDAVRAYSKNLHDLEEQYERAKALAERITAAMGGESVASSKNKTPMENAADRAIEKQAEIDALKAAHERRTAILSALVDSLGDVRQRKAIRGIYFDCEPKAVVAMRIDRTRRHVYNLIDAAIAEMQRMADDLGIE